jgi:twitching motility protein PilT
LHTNDAAQTINRIVDTFPGDQQDQIRVQLASSLIGIFSQRLIPKIEGGLVPAFELLINNSAVSNLIRDNRIHEIPSVIETGLEQGMIDMNRSLARLVQNGIITVESAFTYSTNPKGLERLI